MTRIGKSEAQSIAEARSRTYADDHALSITVKFDRPSHEPRSLREYVRTLRKAYADEVPTRLHSHETDEGGDPAWSPEFTRYLTGSDFTTDRADVGATEVYVTPFRACMAAMTRSSDEATRRRAAIIRHSVMGDSGPVEAAMIEGVPEWCAKIVAREAHAVFWRRLSDVRLDLRPIANERPAA